MYFTFFSKKLRTFFSRRLQNIKAANAAEIVYCQNKTDMVIFLFSVYTITEAKQSNRQGGSQGGGSSSRLI